jgi:hypothetical protein
MEPKFKTSFIPKKQITGPMPGSAVDRLAGFNFVTLLATVIFLAAVLFLAGLVLYKYSLKATIEGQYVTLQKARESFDENLIAQATRLNKRIISAERILENHIAPSEIFTLLQQTTLQTVSLNKLTFSDNIDGEISIEASGEGASFDSIVLQSDEYGRSGFMRDVLFAGLEPNERGNVDFTFEATLEPKLIFYKTRLGVVNTQSATTTINTNETRPAVEQLPDETSGPFDPVTP